MFWFNFNRVQIVFNDFRVNFRLQVMISSNKIGTVKNKNLNPNSFINKFEIIFMFNPDK
jgi:hypothetical protein